MCSWTDNLAHAVRGFFRTPGFTATAVLVLSVGIGANAGVFTVINTLAVKPLSGRADELVGVYCGSRTRPDSFQAHSYLNYADIRDRSGLFDGLLAHTFVMVGEPAGAGVRRILSEFVSSNYFETLGTPLAAGRAFTPAEERPGARAPVAIVSYARWKAANLAPTFIGSTIRVNGQDLTIVGVTPQGFTGTMPLVAAEVYLPLGMFDAVVRDPRKSSGRPLIDRAAHVLVVAGAVKSGLSDAVVNERLAALSRELEAAFPAENRDLALVAKPIGRTMSVTPQTDTAMDVLSGFLLLLAGLILAISCLNVANMLLARGSARRTEIAVRLALGAGRGRVASQLVTEDLVLSAAASVLGLVVSAGVVRALVQSLAAAFPFPLAVDPWPDWRVLLALAGTAVASTLAFGLGPALSLSRQDLVASLKHHSRIGSSRARSGGGVLVVAQIALALVLLTAAGIFARTAWEAGSANPGYRYDGMLVASLDATLGPYDEGPGRQAFLRLLDGVRGLPGVEFASLTSSVPFGDSHGGKMLETVSRSGGPVRKSAQSCRVIGAGYFATLGLGLVRGREFTAAEERGLSSQRSAIIDEALARRLFGAGDAIGQVVRVVNESGEAGEGAGAPIEIVGIAPPIRDELLDRAPVSHLYLPFGSDYEPRMHVQVRVRPGVADTAAVDLLRRSLENRDAGLPVVSVSTMSAFHDSGLELWALRAGGRFLAALGLLATALASVGVFGLISYVVARRTAEFGIRMALGSTPAGIIGLVARDGARLVGAALAVGLPLAALMSFAFTKVFVEIGGIDPVTIAGAAGVLAAAAMAACLLPGRRASRSSPMSALRAE